ncbi:MAG: glutamate racemase [Myxococcales bacterium FL481]|nr:MAG: glutamate racemase [Myxococcales bacterium FL481]
MGAGDNGGPIGVFDSGMGGLTVLRALRESLPRESFVYLGDTARLPYGAKSSDTVRRYAERATRVLVARGIKLLVVACNTASAVALEHLRRTFAPLPVVGVIRPGAQAACVASRTGHVLVIATERTVAERAYERAIAELRPTARVRSQACSVFVALAEEGWFDDAAAEAVARRYLGHWVQTDAENPADCLVLGCTHFPVLAPVIARVVGPRVQIVDSAHCTALEVSAALDRHGLCTQDSAPRLHLMATDATPRFARVGAAFLNTELDAATVELVDLPA